jgi:hypothetical protein
VHQGAGALARRDRIDVVVWVRWYFWNQFDDRQRASVVLHELLHVAVEETKDLELRIRIRDHDVEEFIDVMRWYGALDVGREQLVRAYGLYHEDGGKPKADGSTAARDRVVRMDAETRRRLDRRAKRSRRDDPRDEGEQAADRGDPEAES